MKKDKPEKVSFDAYKETISDLKVITRSLGLGNRANGIRRALANEAERIRSSKSMPSLTAGQRELSDSEKLYVELHTADQKEAAK